MQPYIYLSVGILSSKLPDRAIRLVEEMPPSADIQYYGFTEVDRGHGGEGLVSFARLQCPFHMDEYADTKSLSVNRLTELVRTEKCVDAIEQATKWLEANGLESHVADIDIYAHVTEL